MKEKIVSIYYQFVNFIQTMSPMWFAVIWFILLAGTFACVMKFYKIYNGTQKKIEKASLLISAIMLFALLVYLTSVR